jgi:MtN3 and saliva related transmembrane protein
MDVDWITILGLCAGTCTTFAMAPQAMKVWRTKHVDQLSLRMLVLMFVGIILWLTYGSIIRDLSILWANVIALFFVTYMLVIKVKDNHSKGWRR